MIIKYDFSNASSSLSLVQYLSRLTYTLFVSRDVSSISKKLNLSHADLLIVDRFGWIASFIAFGSNVMMSPCIRVTNNHNSQPCDTNDVSLVKTVFRIQKKMITQEIMELFNCRKT